MFTLTLSRLRNFSCFLCCVWLSSPLCAQVYSVRSTADTPPPVWREAKTAFSPTRAAFYVGPSSGLRPLSDEEGFSVAELFPGVLAGGRVALSPVFSLGAEVQYVPRGRVKVPLMKFVKQQAWYGVARWNLTPNTHPMLFSEIGFGRESTSYQLKYRRGKAPVYSSASFFIGAGTAIWLGGGLWLETSVRTTYLQRRRVGPFLHYASHIGYQGQMWLSYSF